MALSLKQTKTGSLCLVLLKGLWSNVCSACMALLSGRRAEELSWALSTLSFARARPVPAMSWCPPWLARSPAALNCPRACFLPPFSAPSSGLATASDQERGKLKMSLTGVFDTLTSTSGDSENRARIKDDFPTLLRPMKHTCNRRGRESI